MEDSNLSLAERLSVAECSWTHWVLNLQKFCFWQLLTRVSICSRVRWLKNLSIRANKHQKPNLANKILPEAQRTQGIDFITWVNLSARIVQIDFSGTAWIGYKFSHHQMVPLALVPIQSPDGTAWISTKFGHQMAPLALVINLVTRGRCVHWSSGFVTGKATLSWIVLLTLSVTIESVSSSASHIS